MDYLYTDIYKKLEQRIKGMSEGDKLPSERVMVQEYGVSRNVLREALVLLSDRGMIEIRPGKGSYVTDKKNMRLAKHFESILDEDRLSQMQVLEVREILEMAIFEKAALNADQDDIEAMENIYEQMEKNQNENMGYGNLDLKFHMQIAKATHNDIFPILVHTLYECSGQRMMLMEDLFPESMKSIHRDHYGILDAIKRRDVKAVRRIGKRHFDLDRYMLLSMNEIEEKTK
ncbi:MAG: FadR/GntR family transcriptional regulator [Frisingicoccus sp.]|uniref:FadR/GntR family transcriptional regulator n=1 Tax=Frisingicoccus sp. TaxID=1918627 RepID=UPI0025BDB19E|nr:FadR/GntR family transcriptional regulator [Frisingicoccus sp.]MDY4834115.1 FadR/GntR family transcriptional regulator [Frisingicoccus sp.]MDY5956902.1 FadR/GntR family transcriptional regulator [Frisingicoccus sp.]